MDERRLELKVGGLILAAVVAGAVLLALMGELSLGHSGQLAVDFSHTGNVVKGAPVKLGGVAVGRVEVIALLPERRDVHGAPLPVRMSLSLSEEARRALRTDAQITVATVGPLGEAYLELNPGLETAGLAEDTALRGVDAPRLDLVANRLAAFLESAGKALEANPDLFLDLADGMANLSRTVDGVLTDNRSDVKVLVQNLRAASDDLRALSGEARVAMGPDGRGTVLLEDAQASAKLMRQHLPNAGKMVAGLSALSSSFTPEDGMKLRAALERYAGAGERLERVAERGERVLSQIEAGQGSVGGLYKDPTVYQDLKALVSDLKRHPWKVLWKGD